MTSMTRLMISFYSRHSQLVGLPYSTSTCYSPHNPVLCTRPSQVMVHYKKQDTLSDLVNLASSNDGQLLASSNHDMNATMMPD